MAPLAGSKRKIDYSTPGTSAQVRKRQKGRDARAIPTQTADAALSKNGELNIASFVKAREFEIAALQQSMKRSRKGLTQRAFQQVPRHMRRRTASHNVKKIPRRMRARALREIKEDNTPTGSARKRKVSSKLRLRLQTAKQLQKLNAGRKSLRKKKKETRANAKEADPAQHKDVERVPRIKKNQLVTPPQATSKFKRRQINKTWLPTHLWHTKRAHLTRPTLPLWRMAIPLRPTEKSYRPTHRAAGTRGCVAWDTSYISTIGCQGTESALENMLRAIGFDGKGWAGTKRKKWINGTRHSESWTFEDGQAQKPLAPVTVLWQTAVKHADADEGNELLEANAGPLKSKSKPVKLNRRLFLRVHPAAFQLLWTKVMAAAKAQRPQVLLEDLRFEIGSIVVQGPQSTEALAGVLKPFTDQQRVADLWSAISAINNPAVLPLNVVLAMDVADPRLNHPPKPAKMRRDDQAMNRINETIVSWPLDTTSSASHLFEHKIRYGITKVLPSQKAINRRKAALLPGQDFESKETDARIPTILLAERSREHGSNTQGSWTVLLPWGCVDYVWRSLMYCPLSTGNTPRFGGLEQTQQVAFEQCTPWFPGDFPGTTSGKAWDRTQSESRFDAWLRRPTSKRLAWDAVDLGLGRKGELGRGWACDWEHLFHNTTQVAPSNPANKSAITSPETSKSTQSRLLTQRQRKAAARSARGKEDEARRRNSSSPESEDENREVHNDVKFGQLTLSKSLQLTNAYRSCQISEEKSLATIRLKFLTRGTPVPAARIYRLPSVQNLSKEDDQAARHDDTDSNVAGSTPMLFTNTSPGSFDATSLRRRWLDLDPNPTSQGANPKSSTAMPVHEKTEKSNQFGDPVMHTIYDSKHTRDLSHIRVFPPRETKPEILNMFGPRPPPKTQEELRKLFQPQATAKMITNSDGDLATEELWDKHVPCPDPEDLIGYVTSGGYNLVEGRGTAIGAVWLQRVLTGWREEGELDPAGKKTEVNEKESTKPEAIQQAPAKPDMKCGARGPQSQSATKAQKQYDQHLDRVRHLCIVRNAGESIGRLAIWELC